MRIVSTPAVSLVGGAATKPLLDLTAGGSSPDGSHEAHPARRAEHAQRKRRFSDFKRGKLIRTNDHFRMFGALFGVLFGVPFGVLFGI